MLKQEEYFICGDFSAMKDSDINDLTIVILKTNGEDVQVVDISRYYLKKGQIENFAIMLKRLYYTYKPKKIIINGNGIGMALIDYLIIPQVNSNIENCYPGFGICNDIDGYYNKYKTNETEENAIYLMKPNANIRDEAISNLYKRIKNGFNIKDIKNSLSEEILEELKNISFETNILGCEINKKVKTLRRDSFDLLAYGIYYMDCLADNC